MHTLVAFFFGTLTFIASLFGVHQATAQPSPSTVQSPATAASDGVATSTDIGEIQRATLQQNDQFSVKGILPDGVIDAGPYAGYHRILVTLYSDAWSSPDSDGTATFALATKDFKTYVLGNAEQYDLASSLFSDRNIFTSNVVATGTVPFNQPPYLLSGAFVLTRGSPFYDKISDAAQLKSLADGLTFYADADGIVIADAFGSKFSYRLLPREKYAYDARVAGTASPKDYFFDASDIQTSQPIYSKYGDAFPGHCGYGTGSLLEISSIDEANLHTIGTTTYGATVYVPSSSTDPLIQREFDTKITSANNALRAWGQKTTAITLQDYASKHPILLMQDPWGRWVATGEWDYVMPGGCGKPVIYLYPQKDTDVSVRLNAPIDFTTQIPVYQHGWHVLAHPDGTLTDLQPEATDCGALEDTRGSEYAKSACLSNSYPYLYWSGNAYAPYPAVTGGWITSRQDLEHFLTSTLSRIGFTSRETNDFVAYWVPTMLQENAPYFRISFITTQEMNAFIPMSIDPKPDSMYRLFMDWQPLEEKPVQQISAQTLPSIERKGFTAIEWGGLHP